jgi:hypothetical protein
MSNIYIMRHLVSLPADFLGRSVHLRVSSIQGNYVASQIMSSTEDFSMFHLTFSDPEPWPMYQSTLRIMDWFQWGMEPLPSGRGTLLLWWLG